MQPIPTLEQLAPRLAHKFRSPLTAMTAWLYTLGKTLKRSGQGLEDVQEIEREVERLGRMIRDYERFAGPREMKVAPIAARALQAEVFNQAKEYASAQGKVGIIEEGACDSAELEVDAVLVLEALRELVRNAVESADPNGRVRIGFKLSEKRAGMGCFWIEDDGSGLSPDMEGRLGEPFLTTKQNHTGLGLALAGRLLQLHGGGWEGENLPGAGAVFRASLPLGRKEKSV